MEASFKKSYASLGADRLVLLWLGVWWIANLVQAGFTELANDEAYYHMFAERLAWGYFDHPPVTALLVWAGERLFGGELGVRFFFTVLQPLYLWILWRLIRPADAGRRDAALFVVVSAATLMLQLYGFIAVPDGPLMFTAALFLLTFKWFSENRRRAWLWMGIAMALMAYSKYHGALVVLFALAANPRQLLRPALYSSGAVALLLLVPHLVWQYEHDWASFAYHLSGRNSVFRPGYVVEFLANVLVVFNPFFVPLYVQAWRKVKPQTPVGRALKLLPVAFIVFFMLSSLRGYVQPQWVIVSCFGLVCVLFAYARRHPRTRRYVMRAGGVTVGLIVLVRLVMIFNPLGIRFEVFNNPESYAAIAAEADGRPVVFRYGYAVAAKYAFYTGGEAYCQPNIRYRTHQWQFRDDDSQFIGREVLVECPDGTVSDSTRQVRTLTMANGRSFTWFVDPAFHPVRLVDIAFTGLPGRVAAGETLRLELRIRNPYPYAIRVGAGDTQLVMLWKHGRFRVDEFPTGETFTIPADSELTRGVTFTVLPQLAGETFDVGFALRREGYTNWFNGKSVPTEVGNL
ncbi:MAG: ArnT family glycosyltransferase [Alistipes shahii]|uniref:ArnT family glycosyltransferase n=1 Tax=Alistipes shahii TaxID=328814 RepID=UPI00210CD214|nr:glycosyltransferase family 39 protein [Alistipes shahii]MCQ5075348.1 glycosyltransferase family 39 protein [Alistipes shahii]